MTEQCPACAGALATGLRPWHRRCTHCSYEGSVLVPSIDAQAVGGDLDEEAREIGLASLRQRNFRDLAARVARLFQGRSAKPRLLDVGCAHGWFIEAMQARFDAFGIEPDLAIAEKTSARGLPVRHGYFPDVLAPAEMFDVIVFNDVLEHIPDVDRTLQACNAHLAEGGWVIVNAPSRRGALYRIAALMARLGMNGPFDRLWQLGFPSPHVHYFDAASIEAIASKHGFAMVRMGALPSIAVRGLHARLLYGKDASRLKAAVLWVAILLALPVLKVLPADIEVWGLRR